MAELSPPALELPESSFDEIERTETDTKKKKQSRAYSIAALIALTTAALAVKVAPIVAALGVKAAPAWILTVEDDTMTLVGVAIAGFIAQVVDGALGMGYGLTSSTVLVAAGGLSPVTASEVVHLAQLGTTLVSGLAHHRAGTVEWPTARRVAVPGVCGALFGASFLAVLPVRLAKTVASVILLAVGAYLFLRFAAMHHQRRAGGAATSGREDRARALVLAPIGLVGGFVDVAGGGGWGPVATSGLLAEGRLEPSKVVGTVSMSEFFVTVAAVIGFGMSAAAHGSGGAGVSGSPAGVSALRLDLMLALLCGGLLAAPVAPFLVTKLPEDVLGVIVGGFICLTNARAVLRACAASESLSGACLGAWSLIWVCASVRVSMLSNSRERKGAVPVERCACDASSDTGICS